MASPLHDMSISYLFSYSILDRLEPEDLRQAGTVCKAWSISALNLRVQQIVARLRNLHQLVQPDVPSALNVKAIRLTHPEGWQALMTCHKKNRVEIDRSIASLIHFLDQQAPETQSALLHKTTLCWQEGNPRILHLVGGMLQTFKLNRSTLNMHGRVVSNCGTWGLLPEAKGRLISAITLNDQEILSRMIQDYFCSYSRRDPAWYPEECLARGRFDLLLKGINLLYSLLPNCDTSDLKCLLKTLDQQVCRLQDSEENFTILLNQLVKWEKSDKGPRPHLRCRWYRMLGQSRRADHLRRLAWEEWYQTGDESRFPLWIVQDLLEHSKPGDVCALFDSLLDKKLIGCAAATFVLMHKRNLGNKKRFQSLLDALHGSKEQLLSKHESHQKQPWDLYHCEIIPEAVADLHQLPLKYQEYFIEQHLEQQESMLDLISAIQLWTQTAPHCDRHVLSVSRRKIASHEILDSITDIPMIDRIEAAFPILPRTPLMFFVGKKLNQAGKFRLAAHTLAKYVTPLALSEYFNTHLEANNLAACRTFAPYLVQAEGCHFLEPYAWLLAENGEWQEAQFLLENLSHPLTQKKNRWTWFHQVSVYASAGLPDNIPLPRSPKWEDFYHVNCAYAFYKTGRLEDAAHHLLKTTPYFFQLGEQRHAGTIDPDVKYPQIRLEKILRFFIPQVIEELRPFFKGTSTEQQKTVDNLINWLNPLPAPQPPLVKIAESPKSVPAAVAAPLTSQKRHLSNWKQFEEEVLAPFRRVGRIRQRGLLDIYDVQQIERAHFKLLNPMTFRYPGPMKEVQKRFLKILRKKELIQYSTPARAIQCSLNAYKEDWKAVAETAKHALEFDPTMPSFIDLTFFTGYWKNRTMEEKVQLLIYRVLARIHEDRSDFINYYRHRMQVRYFDCIAGRNSYSKKTTSCSTGT